MRIKQISDAKANPVDLDSERRIRAWQSNGCAKRFRAPYPNAQAASPAYMKFCNKGYLDSSLGWAVRCPGEDWNKEESGFVDLLRGSQLT